MKRTIMSIMVLFLLLLTTGMLRAQVDKGVTSIGNEVDCTTINPSVDQTVNQYGEIVTKPSLTRNGMLITADCCPILLDGNLTDTVTCVSISMAAIITDGTVNTAVLQVFRDANRTDQVGSDIETTVVDSLITAQALNLGCHTHYYFRLKLNNQCNYDWTDSTRDLTLDKATTCDVLVQFANEHSAGTGIIDSVSDHEGNAYAVVQIGEQCWLKSNMRCTTSPRQGQTMNGILMNLSRTTTDTSYFTPFYYDYAEVNGDPNPLTLQERGYLYNWSAAIDTVTNVSFNLSFTNRRGICPAGWHLPTYDEWTALERGYLFMPDDSAPIDETELSKINESRGNGSGKFTAGCYWDGLGNTTSPRSYSYAERNITGLSVLPTGYFNGSLLGFGTHAPFWSSTSYSTKHAWFRRFMNNAQGVFNSYSPPKNYGRSVRCIRDRLIPEMVLYEDTTFGTFALKEIKNTVTLEIIQSNVVKKTVNNPGSEIYVNDLPEGIYQVKATSSTGDTLVDAVRVKHTYTHCAGTPRAGATLANGKLANNEWSSVVNQIDSVSDHEGNVYEVVQIGNQCWLKENMRCTTSPRQGSGTGKVNLIDGGTTSTEIYKPRYYDYNTTTGDHPQMLTERQRGLLYNWVAAMDTTYAESTIPVKVDFPNRRGICPVGWHLPTNSEWLVLEKQFLMENDGITPISDEMLNTKGEVRDSGTKGAGKFIAGCAWNGTGNSTSPNSYTYAYRNLSGFSALPAGSNSGSFANAGKVASFWTASSDIKNYALFRRFKFDAEGIHYLNTHSNYGRSVRCVRDIECDFVPETSCTVPSVRTVGTGADQSHEHGYNGSTTQIDSVYDHEGNAYGVVQIGNQCWLKSNMRATTTPKTSPTSILKQSSWGATPLNQYATNLNDASVISSEYGLFYNWAAALDTSFSASSAVSFTNRRGICPKGWHIPSNDEWIVLMGTAGVGVGAGGTGAGRLATGCNWTAGGSASQPGNKTYADRNKWGFSAFPTGYYVNKTFISFGVSALFCSSNSSDATHYVAWEFNGNTEHVANTTLVKQDASSVRCLRDRLIPEISVCEDTTFGRLTLTTLTNTAKVDFYQGSTLKKTDNAPTQGKVYSDLPQGTYSVIATSSSGHTDTVTAYVKHTYTHCTGTPQAGTTLANGKLANNEWGSSVTHQIDSVSDHEGNVYEVVQINGQCWLKQNMRATTEPSGTLILQNPATTASFTDRIAYAVDNNLDNIPVYGLLYNWPAAVDTTASTTKVISFVGNRRGICPQGWHLPSASEYQGLFSFLAVGVGSGSGVTKLVSGCGWNSASGETPGNPSTETNVSGLSFVPTGFYSGGFSSVGELTSLWTTANNVKNSSAYAVNFNSSYLTGWSTDNNAGRSVRCVRNTPVPANISFNANGGTATMEAMTVTTMNDTVLNANTFTHSGNAEFAGWSTDQCSSDIAFEDESQIYPLDDVSLYAQWNSFCTVNSVRAQTGTDQSHENGYKGNNTQIDSVYDHEGNAYGVTQIGGLCWMKENMRAISSPSGKEITLGAKTAADDVLHYYKSTNVNSADVNYELYGCLYNWAALMDTTSGKVLYSMKDVRRGICPDGWHVPGETEWSDLEKQIANTTLAASDLTRTTSSTKLDAGRLAAGCNWGTVKTGLTYPACYNETERNSTLFSALPGGFKTYASSGTKDFTGVNTNAYFWSATEKDNDEAYVRGLVGGTAGVSRTTMNKYQRAVSVRCVRDIPYVFSNMETTEVTCSSVHFAAKMSEGIVSYNTTVLLSTQSDFSDTVAISTMVVSADSMISADFYDLKTNTTYYIKVAQNTTNFTTQLCACDVASVNTGNERALNGDVYEVQDVDGNWYGVVQIGDQCWTRQNMRCTASPTSGTRIVANNNYYSSICKSARWYANDSTNYASYGLLYNACAALDMTRPTASTELPTANSEATWQYTAPAGFVQGICPAGWHVPSDAEWTTMENYVVTDNHYGVSSNTEFGTSSNATFPSDNAREGSATSVSPMLAYPTSWTSVTTSNATASSNEYRNVTQFDAKASGYCLKTFTPAGIGTYAAYWTSTPNGNNMFLRQMRNTTAGIGRLYTAKYCDLSVRCVRDVPTLTVTSDKTTANICVGEVASVTYTATLSCATTSSYTWSTGDVTSTNTLTVPYTSTGTYTVSCTAVGLQSNSVSVTIKNGAVGKFGVCEDLISGTAQVIDQGNCNSFVWKNASDVTVKTGTNISVSETIPEGVYTVVGSSSTACPASKTVTLGNYVSKPCHVSNRGGNESGSESGLVETVTDHQNNSYTVVEIGNQCWMRENLRCTQDLSGNNLIYSYNDNRFDAPRACYYNNESALGNTYGVLYNWKAVMNGASATTANPSNVRGLCPVGWHVPSKAEWQQLVTYTGANSQSGKLASGCDWVWEPQYGTVPTASPADYNFANRNNFGFSARPFGSAIYGGVWGLGGNAIFWSTTELSSPENQCLDISDYSSPQMVTLSSENNAYFFLLNNTSSAVYYANPNNMITPNLTYTQKDNAYYVRCVRDN